MSLSLTKYLTPLDNVQYQRGIYGLKNILRPQNPSYRLICCIKRNQSHNETAIQLYNNKLLFLLPRVSHVGCEHFFLFVEGRARREKLARKLAYSHAFSFQVRSLQEQSKFVADYVN